MLVLPCAQVWVFVSNLPALVLCRAVQTVGIVGCLGLRLFTWRMGGY